MRRSDCPDAGREDRVEAYVAGRLDEEAAARFEEHYFGCDACWAEVELALALHATLAVGSPAAERRSSWQAWPLAGLLAASLVTVAVLGVSPALVGERPVGDATPAPTVWRGASALAIIARIDGAMLRIEWPPEAGAASYVVEVTASDGALRARQETIAPPVEIPRARLEPLTGATLRIEVRALDALGNVVAESEAFRLEGDAK